MTRKLIVEPDAEAEFRASAEWYEERRLGLGVEFAALVDEAIASIAARPERWPLWRPDRPYRKRVVQRFPYVIFYTVSKDEIRIRAIAHSRRRPGYWTQR